MTNHAQLKPFRPHVEGFIRFAWEPSNEGGATRQRPEFELLTHVHAAPPRPGQPPVMQQHPLGGQLARSLKEGAEKKAKASVSPQTEEGSRALLREVPIRLVGKTPDSNLSARFVAYRADDKPVCWSAGEKASCSGLPGGSRLVDCKGPLACEYAKASGWDCKLQSRLLVRVEGSTDPLAAFEFQSGGVNTHRSLAAKLEMLHACLGDLRAIPLRLTSWAKSSAGSSYEPFYCATLELPEGMTLGHAKTAISKSGDDLLLTDQMEATLSEFAKASQYCVEDDEEAVFVARVVSAQDLRNARQLKRTAAPAPLASIADIMGRVMAQPQQEPVSADIPLLPATHSGDSPVTAAPIVELQPCSAAASTIQSTPTAQPSPAHANNVVVPIF